MSTIETIVIFVIVVGSIFLAVFISLFKLVAGMFYAPVPYYPIQRRTMETNNAKGGDNRTRILSTIIFLILMLLWMAPWDKADGRFKSELPGLCDSNTAVMSAMISIPGLVDTIEESPFAAIENKESADRYYVQFAAITDQLFAEETQQRLRTSLHQEVIILKNETWHFLLVGPFDKVEDAKDYAKSTGLENLIKSDSEIGI